MIEQAAQALVDLLETLDEVDGPHDHDDLMEASPAYAAAYDQFEAALLVVARERGILRGDTHD